MSMPEEEKTIHRHIEHQNYCELESFIYRYLIHNFSLFNYFTAKDLFQFYNSLLLSLVKNIKEYILKSKNQLKYQLENQLENQFIILPDTNPNKMSRHPRVYILTQINNWINSPRLNVNINDSLSASIEEDLSPATTPMVPSPRPIDNELQDELQLKILAKQRRDLNKKIEEHRINTQRKHNNNPTPSDNKSHGGDEKLKEKNQPSEQRDEYTALDISCSTFFLKFFNSILNSFLSFFGCGSESTSDNHSSPTLTR